MNKEQTGRLIEIINLAKKLGWIETGHYYPKQSYPLMQLSEVEKCMTALVDDFELQRMRDWVKEQEDPAHQERMKQLTKEYADTFNPTV